jgi:hypothetical protein
MDMEKDVNHLVGKVMICAAQMAVVASVALGLDEADAQAAFTCAATIRKIIKESDGGATIVVKDGCGIEPIRLRASPPSECVVSKRVTATGTLMTEGTPFGELGYLGDVTKIACK